MGMAVSAQLDGLVQNSPPTTRTDNLYADSQPRRFEFGNIVTSFVVSAALVLLIGMALFGTWVTQRSTDAILQHSAHSAAMFMDSAIEPLVQELANEPQLSPQSVEAIDRLLTHKAINRKLSGIMIWRRDGVVAYARNRDLIGKAQPVTRELQSALDGHVEIEQLRKGSSAEGLYPDSPEGSYKIYSPMHQLGTNDVIAVAGYVEPPHTLDSLLAQGRRDTWVVVGIFTILIFSLTFNLIHHASEMIKEQNKDLRERYDAQLSLNHQNRLLQRQLQDAHQKGIEINEDFLRRISADLHDGPAQFLALALLRVDDIAPATPEKGTDTVSAADVRRLKALETVRSATASALMDIRSISTGLALPELQDHSPVDAIEAAVNSFVAATQTKVTCNLAELPDALPMPWTVCLFRFVQEGLSNGLRHAGGIGLEVRSRVCDGAIAVEIVDQGPGFDAREGCSKARLGLIGLRHRIEVLGGQFEVKSSAGQGTTIRLVIPPKALHL
jgi:signal transduction histidine kinase